MIRSSVQRMTPYAPGEQPRVASLIKLNTNENPYPPSPRVAEALRAFDSEKLRLYPDPMAIALREAIAELHGCGVENVFAGNGSDEILALCTRAYVEPDGVIAWFDPSYSLYPVLTAIADVRGAAIPLTDAFGLPPVSQLPTPISVLFVTTPNAPTGVAFPRAQIEALCAGSGGVVLLDEAYADFAPDQFVDLALRYPNVLVSRSLSKSYSLAGLRLGYAIGPAPLIEALYKIKDSYNLDAFAQALGLAAVRDQAWMRENVRRIISTRERVADELNARGWHVLPSAANFVFARPPNGDARSVFDRLRTANILVRHFPGPRTGEYLRVTIGTDPQMDAFLAHIS